MALTVSLPIAATVTQTSSLDIAAGSAPLAFLANYVFSSGTSAYQGTTFTSDQRTLGAGAVDALDLAGGLVDIFGNVVTFTRIRAFLVETDVAAAGNLSVFSPGAGSFFGPASGGEVLVRPSCVFICVAPNPDGWPVTPGSGDIFRLTNNAAGNIIYNIIIIGMT